MDPRDNVIQRSGCGDATSYQSLIVLVSSKCFVRTKSPSGKLYNVTMWDSVAYKIEADFGLETGFIGHS
jgi:hypothetical protein